MLADQFLEAAGGARTGAALDELARKLWRAHAEGHIADADAEALSESIEARRATLAGKVVWDTQISQIAASGLRRVSGRARSNASLLPEKRIVFRVGIHLGDGRASTAGGLGDRLVARDAKPAPGVVEGPQQRLEDRQRLRGDLAIGPALLGPAGEAAR